MFTRISGHNNRTLTLSLALCLMFISQACSHGSTYHVTERGRHKITVVGHDSGITSNDGLYEDEGVAIVRRNSPIGPDTELVIKDEELVVNGRKYGTLKEGDSIKVDRGKVFVNDTEVQEIARR